MKKFLGLFCGKLVYTRFGVVSVILFFKLQVDSQNTACLIQMEQALISLNDLLPCEVLSSEPCSEGRISGSDFFGNKKGVWNYLLLQLSCGGLSCLSRPPLCLWFLTVSPWLLALWWLAVDNVFTHCVAPYLSAPLYSHCGEFDRAWMLKCYLCSWCLSFALPFKVNL